MNKCYYCGQILKDKRSTLCLECSLDFEETFKDRRPKQRKFKDED